MKIQLLRGYNFFYFSMFSIFLTFLPIYFSAKGISATQIGLIFGAGSLIGVISQPLWGMISDKYKTVKIVLLLLLILSVTLGTLLFQSSNLLVSFLLCGLMYFFFMPTDPLTESLNYRVSVEERVNFGSIRMFGALGFSVASFIVGYAADYYGIGSFAYLFAGYGIITILLCITLPEVKSAAKPIALTDMKRFFSDKRTLLFFSLVLLIAIPHRMNDSYLGLYLQSLGGGVGTVGLAWFVMTLIETVFFAIIHRFVKPGNELGIISIAAAVYALRFALSGIWSDPIAIVAFQLLHGLSFVLFYTASIQYLYTLIPEEWKATGQTLLAMLLFGVSSIIASTVGGWLFDHLGGRMLYAIMTILSLLGVGYGIAIRHQQQKKRIEEQVS